ncbi:MAG: hypothetical protein L3J54_10935 [Draconibacterium sp.]|nr:hypothetical protein [Draconibacterium sp.]
MGIFLLAKEFSSAGTKDIDIQFLRHNHPKITQKNIRQKTNELIALLPANTELETEFEFEEIINSVGFNFNKIKHCSFNLLNYWQNTIIPLFNDLPPPLPLI